MAPDGSALSVEQALPSVGRRRDSLLRGMDGASGSPGGVRRGSVLGPPQLSRNLTRRTSMRRIEGAQVAAGHIDTVWSTLRLLDAQLSARTEETDRRRQQSIARCEADRRENIRRSFANKCAFDVHVERFRGIPLERRFRFPPMYGNTHGYRHFSFYDTRPKLPKPAPWVETPRGERPSAVRLRSLLAEAMPPIVDLFQKWNVDCSARVELHELRCAIGALRLADSAGWEDDELGALLSQLDDDGSATVDFGALFELLRPYAPPPTKPPAEQLAREVEILQGGRIPRRHRRAAPIAAVAAAAAGEGVPGAGKHAEAVSALRQALVGSKRTLLRVWARRWGLDAPVAPKELRRALAALSHGAELKSVHLLFSELGADDEEPAGSLPSIHELYARLANWPPPAEEPAEAPAEAPPSTGTSAGAPSASPRGRGGQLELPTIESSWAVGQLGTVEAEAAESPDEAVAAALARQAAAGRPPPRAEGRRR